MDGNTEYFVRKIQKYGEYLTKGLLDGIQQNKNDILKEDKEMKQVEKEKWTEIINGMGEDELQFVSEHIPVELCIKRVVDVLKKQSDLLSNIRKTVSIGLEKDPVDTISLIYGIDLHSKK